MVVWWSRGKEDGTNLSLERAGQRQEEGEGDAERADMVGVALGIVLGIAVAIASVCGARVTTTSVLGSGIASYI